MICSLCGIADLFGSSHQSSDNACLDVMWMVRLVMKVPVSVSWFTVDLHCPSQPVHQERRSFRHLLPPW